MTAVVKRVTSWMSPVVLRDGSPRYALGPRRAAHFPAVMQALSNPINHAWIVQETVEAPRPWTQGYALEVEASLPEGVLAALRDRDPDVAAVGNVGGSISAIQFDADDTMIGAARWRAEDTPIGLGSGSARRGARFRLDQARS
ncbi:gamma-glutamyltransferase [Mesorhizobium caraganae]|uniref:gamma-glutamyltransferase n=1 Tax=Mesorhizobium caraganae TaxID=483206 RepID=UPI001939745E|nr:gamma-glutamyltransferase [Mesorhizobium caraganae]MBM2716085.1 gamma-glutamyltransferase [Mesorhizobium caraganae]